MSIWDVELDKLRASRLLALRMHVARYFVRSGARQPAAIALVDDQVHAERRGRLVELLEAAGALEPHVAALPADAARFPAADVVLIGERGRAPAEVARRWRDQGAAHAGRVWAVDVDRLTAGPDETVVDAVEALIRIVVPEALGANGTPPSEDVAVRLAPGA